MKRIHRGLTAHLTLVVNQYSMSMIKMVAQLMKDKIMNSTLTPEEIRRKSKDIIRNSPFFYKG